MKEIFEKMDKFAKLLDELLKKSNKITEEMAKNIKQSLGDSIDIDTIYNMARNYEIKQVNIYSLEDALKWFKEKDKDNPNLKKLRKGIYRLTEKEGNKLVIYLFFIDSEAPVLDGNLPVCVIYTLKLDEDLNRFFAKKSLLILSESEK